jgi:hypothetical protein
MVGVLLSALLVVGAPPEQAPPPREVRPDVSLIVSTPIGKDGSLPVRVQRIGFRNGTPMAAETIIDCDENALKLLGVYYAASIRANRYVVSTCGSVLDLREKKFINSEQAGEVVCVDDTHVTYRIDGENREPGLFAFEYATGKLRRVEKLKPPLIPEGVQLSPDGTKAVAWADNELFLHRDGQKPKSLGDGFKLGREPARLGRNAFEKFPLLWVDNDRFLTQRERGKLVTVSIIGQVTEVVTIKNLPDEKDAYPDLIHEPDGSIVFFMGHSAFKIDIANKTAVKSDWRGLGQGFELARNHTYEPATFRQNGKDIGRFACSELRAVAAPGHVAVPVPNGDRCGETIAVWSAATGEWTTFEFRWLGVLGWVK